MELMERRISALRECSFIPLYFRPLVSSPPAAEFFSEGSFKAVGIDGSQSTEERLEMLLFYVCAAAYSCSFEVSSEIEIHASTAERDEALTVSSCIPLWMEDVVEVNPRALYAFSDFEFKRSIESIPNSLMTLAELHIALKALANDDVKVVLLDRLISGTYGPSSRDLRRLIMKGSSALEEIATPYGNLSLLDLRLALRLGDGSLTVPARSVHGAYALIKLLIEAKRRGEEGLTPSDVKSKLRVSKDAASSFIKMLRKIDKEHGHKLLEEGDRLSVKSEVMDYWRRVSYALEVLFNHLFEQDEEHPLLIHERWLTTLDLNAMTAISLIKLLVEARRRRKLVLGIAKDTNATDFLRSAMPILELKRRGDFRRTAPLRSDRAFLTILSASRCSELPTPWRTIEYDYCYSTMRPHVDLGLPGVEAIAARKVVFHEQLIVKGYFQLRSSPHDSSVRSPVFVYDRPFYPEFDGGHVVSIVCLEGGRNAKPWEVRAFTESEERSLIGDLALAFLSRSDNPAVIEGLGYNQLLLLADKYVKALSRQAKSMLRGVADLDLVAVARKYKAFFAARRFRDLRSEAEHMRERVGGV
ncbi:MAG: hypothetical protein DRJ68_04340 [Thermoprotei archaeon]|nr:MAG: hypothetical protein DRJ68_04340 [Thermoprotei archaeon]